MSASPEHDRFAPTRWTLVLRARGDSPEARAALAELFAVSYQPVFVFLRSEGRSEDAARELTQEFFARLLSGGGLGNIDPRRGRFRSFLLGAAKHFLADRRDREQAAKRGGGQVHVPIEPGADTAAELPIPDPATPAPDAVFDRQWAIALVNRAVAALEADSAAGGRQRQFEVLKPWLLGDLPSMSQADAGHALGMNEGAVKVAVHRLRQRYRELLRLEVAKTLSEGESVDQEIRDLIAALAD